MPTRFLVAAFTAALSFLTLPAAAQTKASEIPVESFFKRQDLASMSLSPNGTHLAALKNHKGRTNIVVVNIENRKPYLITSFEQFDVVDFTWVNDKRVFFRVAETRDVLGNTRYQGTYAIDIDGENLRNLSDGGRAIKEGARQVNNIFPLRRGADGTDEMIVAMGARYDGVDVFRIDTKTGRVIENLTSDAPEHTTSFLLDWDKVPRVAFATDPRKGQSSVWYRDTKTSPWELLTTYNGVLYDAERIRPVAFNADNKTLFVASNVGRDKAAIYTYDPKAKKLGDLVFEHPLIDVWGGLQFDASNNQLVGIRFVADEPTTIWIHPEYKKVQAQIDATLPKTINVISRGADNLNRVLIYAYSETDPGRYYLLNRNPTKMEELLPSRAELKPELMSPRKFITYKARDGLEIPAYVTIPKESSGKNLPLIVNIHGGPWLRVYNGPSWGRPEAQFFASRGYVVLEAEPRASDGFGRKHVSAGYRQFGQAMQNDITDGVLHLIKEGIVDKNRVCLFGASYGGYATLQGLVREPELFKCGAAFVAVTDLVEWVTSNESDTNMGRWDSSAFFNVAVGDPSKDRAMMVANSPAQNAKKIKVPVLLAMGQIDVRVPLEHGRMMRSAMEQAGVKHEYLVYPGEGHGWNKDEHIFDWYKRSEKFFAENLK